MAYYFPPIGGAGVQRNAKFARYLPELGYEPVVVTGPGSPEYRWTPIDGALAVNVPTGTAVHRLPAPEPRRGHGWRAKAERWLRIRPQWERWWSAEALPAARALAAGVDVVHASINPYQTAPVARRLARELGKPFVVDLEDPWAFDEMLVYPTAMHRRFELAAMRRTLAAADAVVMNTREAARRVEERFPELAGKPVIAIPNGFDSADFTGPLPQREDGTFRIVHTGSLHTDLGRRHRQMALVRHLLGGAAPGVDLLTRSHIYLLEAIAALRAEEPELAARIEVHLAGDLTVDDLDVATRHPNVQLHGFLPHDETIRLMRSADLLFLPLHDLPPGRRVSIVPCKTYEYLASGRPILAAVPDGDARDLLAGAGSTFLCRPTDADAMKRHIRRQLERRLAGEPPEPRNASILAELEPRRLTGRLVDLYDQLSGAQAGARARPLATAAA
jgi:glycosyltransferase involved in cell wall biosynthesis